LLQVSESGAGVSTPVLHTAGNTWPGRRVASGDPFTVYEDPSDAGASADAGQHVDSDEGDEGNTGKVLL
jgi:hypothetical protein